MAKHKVPEDDLMWAEHLGHSIGSVNRVIARLTRERDELREALTTLADAYEGFNAPYAMDWAPADDLILADARKALAALDIPDPKEQL